MHSGQTSRIGTHSAESYILSTAVRQPLSWQDAWSQPSVGWQPRFRNPVTLAQRRWLCKLCFAKFIICLQKDRWSSNLVSQPEQLLSSNAVVTSNSSSRHAHRLVCSCDLPRANEMVLVTRCLHSCALMADGLQHVTKLTGCCSTAIKAAASQILLTRVQQETLKAHHEALLECTALCNPHKLPALEMPFIANQGTSAACSDCHVRLGPTSSLPLCFKLSLHLTRIALAHTSVTALVALSKSVPHNFSACPNECTGLCTCSWQPQMLHKHHTRMQSCGHNQQLHQTPHTAVTPRKWLSPKMRPPFAS